MLDKDRVFTLFLLFADLEEPAGVRLRPLCDASAESLGARLADSAELGRNMERLCIAAAALAYCDFCEMGSATQAQEIRVGEVSLRSSAASSVSAKDLSALREHFLTDIADLLRPAFVFGQVES